VVLIGRPQLVEAVERQGLRLETQTFDEHVRVSASTEGSAVQGAQLVLCRCRSLGSWLAGRIGEVAFAADERVLPPSLGGEATLLKIAAYCDDRGMTTRRSPAPWRADKMPGGTTST
jgi:hypothetical protein